ncbi:rap guanine nucleotide exchange factor 1-like [Sycon ciliatum]|uniref:rap guanine nucleotide exchange factor 1-like n=1 Tax=Sycon ciliatum TaxID=27933 RepID=UPI0031F6534E
MAVQESSAERVRRFQAKLGSSLNYVLAAAQSGKGFKTELMEGTSELLDNTQHFMNSVTTLVVTSGNDAVEFRDQVTAKRYELCGQLAELIRICDRMILSEELPSTQETESFAATITQLAEELMKVIAPLIERRLSGGTVRGQASPQRAVRGGSQRGKYYSSGSLTISRSVGLASSGDLASLPNDSFMRGDSADSGIAHNGEHHPAAGYSSSVFATMPKSMVKKRAKLTRRPSGGNLFEVKQETKAEVVVPGNGPGAVSGRARLRSTSHGEGPKPAPAAAKGMSLSQQKALSLSSPLLNQIKQADGAADGDPKQGLQRTVSHTTSRSNVLELGVSGQRNQPRDGSTAAVPPLLPPKKRPPTPGSRNMVISDIFANATAPPRVPHQSTQMRQPASPEVHKRSPKSSPQVALRSSSHRPGTVTEVRVESPEGWSPSEAPLSGSLSSTSGSFVLQSTVATSGSPYSQGGSTSGFRSSSAAATAVQDTSTGMGVAGPPPKPYHPTLSRPHSAMPDLASGGGGGMAAPPEKPPHPTLRKNRSSKLDVISDSPPPAKPPRPPTLTFNPDDPPPLPPKKKALVSYLEQFGTYQSPTDQDWDAAPRIKLGGLNSAQVVTPSKLLTAPVLGRSESVPPVISRTGPRTYYKEPLCKTRSVLGSELNIPPPLPVKTRKGSASGASVKRSGTNRSNGSARRDMAIAEEPEIKNEERPESPVQLPVGSSDSGVHTSSDQLYEDDRLSQSSSPEVYQERDPPLNLLYYSDVGYYLVFNEDAEGHSLLGGPVDALIAHAAADQKHESDRLYHEAFLLTYRTFVEPDVLIEKLLERHDTFLEDGNDVICHATLSLLLRVVDEIKGSMDKSITQRLLDTVFRLLCDNELKLGQLLHNKLFENLKAKGQKMMLAREALASSKGPPPADWSIARFRSRQVAQQLTLIDFAFYNAVEVHECLTWSVHQSEERCPTLTAFTEHFNNVSYWVRTRLLESEKKSEREKVMSKFIKVIEHLREMNNFNSMFALLAAMDCAAVNRMNWPKEAIKSLEEPRKIIDNMNGFKNYRDGLAASGSPCIPYLGLYLQDLTFINIGNTNMLDDNKDCVNFAKRWRQFKVMCKIKQYQQHGYESTKRDEDIIQYFNGFSSHLGEEELWERSMLLKPRAPS